MRRSGRGRAEATAVRRGGYFNAEESPELPMRSKELFDGALPAANGVAALNLLDLHAASGERRFLEEAERTLRAFASLVVDHTDGACTLTIAFGSKRCETRRQEKAKRLRRLP
jgi:uncharacterized protein YyaL (SSP411 family)